MTCLFSLRAVAKATQKEFATAQARRCIQAQRELEKLAAASGHRAIQNAAETMRGIRFRKEQLPLLPQVADRLSELAFAFAAKNDGSNLQAIDEFLPLPADYR